jgi:hypothetical protein
MIISGIPTLLILLSLIVIATGSRSFSAIWDEWGGFVLHIPISIGLFWILFAKETAEDEMYFGLRLKAMFHGVRFVFAAFIFLPFISIVRMAFGYELTQIDVGGNLAVVSLLLLYANGSYWIMKKKMEREE